MFHVWYNLFCLSSFRLLESSWHIFSLAKSKIRLSCGSSLQHTATGPNKIQEEQDPLHSENGARIVKGWLFGFPFFLIFLLLFDLSPPYPPNPPPHPTPLFFVSLFLFLFLFLFCFCFSTNREVVKGSFLFHFCCCCCCCCCRVRRLYVWTIGFKL